MNPKERLKIYEKALHYYNTQRLGGHVGFCTLFNSMGLDIDDLPEIMSHKPNIRNLGAFGLFWFDTKTPEEFAAVRAGVLEKAIAKLKAIIKATEESGEIPAKDRAFEEIVIKIRIESK